MKITNNTKSAIPLPNRQVIPAKGTEDLRDLEELQSNPIFQAWVKQRLLTLSDDGVETAASPAGASSRLALKATRRERQAEKPAPDTEASTAPAEHTADE